MLKKLAPLSLVFAAMSAQADTLGVQAGLSSWSPSFDGGFDSGDATIGEISMKNDLGYSDTSVTGLFVAFEHPVPVIPNFRFESTGLSESSTNTISREIKFEGKTFNQNSKVKSKFDLSHTDWTGYYQLFDDMGGLHADVGLTIRKFDGEIQISDETGATNASLELDVPVPMLYGKGDFDIPAMPFPLSVGGMINYLNVGGATLSDTRFYVAAAAPLPIEVGGELGYRSFNLDFDDVGDLTSDLSASGWYASAVVKF